MILFFIVLLTLTAQLLLPYKLLIKNAHQLMCFVCTQAVSLKNSYF